MDDFTVIHILEEVAFMQQPLTYRGIDGIDEKIKSNMKMLWPKL